MAVEPSHLLFHGYMNDDIAFAIASVISGLAQLEYKMDELSWTLAGVEPEAGACLTAQFSSVRARTDALVSLCHLAKLPPKTISHVNKWCKSAMGLADKRNRLAHDPWATDIGTGEVYRWERTARGGLTDEYKLVTPLEMRELVAEAERLAESFNRLRDEVLDAFYKPSP